MQPNAQPFFTDAQVKEMCEGLKRPAAQLRYLRDLGLLVSEKPNGKPLLAVSEFERVLGASRFDSSAGHAAAAEPDTNALLRVIKGHRHGQKTQGRQPGTT